MLDVKTRSESRSKATFGTRLLEAVKEAGGPVKQEHLSEWFKANHKIIVSGPMINKYKKNDAAPRMDQCREYAVALGVTVEWLLTGRGAKYPQSGPISPTEQRVLGMWRRLTPPLKQLAFAYVATLRMTPDVAPIKVTSEAEIDAIILDSVTETGEFMTLHEPRPKYE